MLSDLGFGYKTLTMIENAIYLFFMREKEISQV
jgi:hypothetical protein